MAHPFRQAAALALTLVLAAGCDNAESGPEAEFFSAAISLAAGDVSYFTGDGRFMAGRETDTRPAPFMLHSMGIGSSRGESFQLARRIGGMPGVGSFTMGAVGTGADFMANWGRRDGDSMEHYAATGGTVTITLSTERRIEGTFAFSGTRVARCERADDLSRNCTFERAGNGPAVTIEGEFSAVRVHRPATRFQQRGPGVDG
jgi:hypothetical protein